MVGFMLIASVSRAEVVERVIEIEEYGIKVNITERLDGAPTVSAQCLIPWSREVVWRVLSDYEALDELVPAVTKSQVIGEDNDVLILRQEGRAGMWFVRRDFTVTFRVKEQPMNSIEFDAFEGDFERFEGKWQVKPMRAGTLVRHEVTVVPRFWAPEWSLRRIARQMIQETIQGVVRRCFEIGETGNAAEKGFH
jgi:ribosome-associated toxin RatA of RatAB toxin-antitoxin module